MADGTVTREGDVDSWAQRQDAARTVGGLMGARNVINMLEVKAPASPLSSLEVHRAIEQALERQALRESHNIRLAVRDGTVILKGLVQSWAERELMVGAVGGTRGVRSIENHLQIA